MIVGYACTEGVEDGGQARIDTTGVESNIHHPTDSHRLWDCVRVLTRILQRPPNSSPPSNVKKNCSDKRPNKSIPTPDSPVRPTRAIISATKRAFGLARCTWSGFASFQAYVQLAVLAFNLQTLARHLLVSRR